MPELQWQAILNWGLVLFLGALILWRDVPAIGYFRRQEKLMGSNWVIHAFYRTTVVITTTALILVAMRIVVLLIGSNWWTSIIQSVAIIWLLLKPDRLKRYFEEHEGRREEPMSTMDRFRSTIRRRDRSEDGQTLVEYGLLLALIAVVVIVALLLLGPVVAELFNNIGNTIDNTPPQ
jgi:pilus assembly protein Flp/PilA